MGLKALLVISLANMALTITVTRSVMFEKFREWTKGIRLFSCPYCFSHWTAFVLVWLTGLGQVDKYDWRDWVVPGFHSQAVYHFDIIFFQHLYVFDPITYFIQCFAVIGLTAFLTYSWIAISELPTP